MINTLDFKYEFLINSLTNLLRMLTNQLLSIFIIQEENVITFLRNHSVINIDFLCKLLTQYIRQQYTQPINNPKKSIQQAIDFTISQLRCYQQPYNHKKYIILSDFTNFSYQPFQTFDLWDSQGYKLSINGIFIGSWKLNGYETFKFVVDPQLIEDYVENINGSLYDINLCNRQGIKINIDEFSQSPPKIILYQTKYLLGQYQTKYPQELLQMRIKEGFKGQNQLTIRINDQMGLLYEINEKTVYIYLERTTSAQILQMINKKNPDLEQQIQKNCKTLYETYYQRDFLQSVILDIKTKYISFEDGIKLLIENKAFENQKFINRNYKQISLVYLIKAIDFRQFQEEGEEFNKYQFYQYIRSKIQEIGTKKIENCLLYQQGSDFVLIRIIWHSHTILRLICIYENEEMLPNLQNRLREVFKSNQILRNSLIEFDHSLKNLLIKSETDFLKKNPDIFVLEQQWEWSKTQIWDMQSMYRILTSLRVKSNYYRVPSVNDRNNKYFVAQIEQDQKIVIVQNLILQDDKIICNIFTENLITNVRNVLLDYFEKIKEFEKQIIISLHTAHCMYRQSLIKKQNQGQVDFFTIQFLQRKTLQTIEQYVKAFREYAQQQAAYYPPPTSSLDYNSLIEKAFLYQEIKQKQIDSGNRYLQVLQQIADHCVHKGQIDKDLMFIVIGPQKMLMISYEKENTTFYLISLEQLERNHKPHSFLTPQLEKKIDAIINYVHQEYNSVFAKEIHQQYTQGLPVQNLKSAIEGCQIEKLEFDLNQAYKDVQQLFDLQPRKITRRLPNPDDSPAKQLKKLPSTNKQELIKQKFCNYFCDKWQERLIKLMSEHKISMKLINDRWYFYDKQDRNETILFLNMTFKEIFSKENKENDVEYCSVQELFDSQRNNKSRRTKIVIQYLIYYYEQRNLQKIINEGIEICNQPDEQTSIKRKIQRWSDPFRKYNNEFTKKFQLEIKRLLPINEDNIQTIYQLLEGMEQRVIEFKIADRRFDHNFTRQFSDEIRSACEQNKALKFINISDEYYIYVINSENCNLELFNEFVLEKEYLIDEQQIVPFWFIIRIQETQLQIQSYTEYQYDSIRTIISLIKQSILEIIERTQLYLVIRRATESSNKVKFILTPHFEIDEETLVMNEQPQQLKQQNFTQRNPWRAKTQVQNQVQELKEYSVPFVGWRVFHPYQLKKPYIQHLINNTILMNHQIDQNQYYGTLDNQYYLFMFQAVKNIQNYNEKYPELCQEVLTGQISVIMNVYSTYRNENKIQKKIDYFYDHIKQNVEEDIINALSQGVIRNPRLKEQEFQLIQRGEHSYMEILLNENIKDMLAFSCFMRHNLEKTFCKYEIQQQNIQQDKLKSDIQLHDLKFIVDQHENSFIFSKYKVVYSPNVNMSNFFGQGLCLFNFLYQVDGGIIVSYQYPRQPKSVQQEELLNIPSHLPVIQHRERKRTVSGEICYDITENHSERFLIIDIISRGSLEWDAFKELFQVLVRQVELEYQMEIIHLKGITQKNIDMVINTFNHLKHYSFKLHHFVYPLYYEEIKWKKTLQWINNKIYAEFEKKGIYQQITSQFEKHFYLKNPDPLGYNSQIYYITDGLDYDQAIQLDAIKHITQQKQKKNDPIDLYHRSVLVFVKIQNNTLDVFLYNLNCDIAANLNHQIGILSRWSIIRNLVAQKIKNDLQGCYNIRLSPLYEEVFIQKHNIYQHSIVNELLRLRSQDQNYKKIKREDQPDQFQNVSKAIEFIIEKDLPPTDTQLFEFVKHLEKFFKLNFCVLKQKKLNINYKIEGDFLEREGSAFLEQLKEFYKTYIQTQQIKYVRLMQISNDVQAAQSKPILDKILSQSQTLYLNCYPLYIFRMKNKSDLKGTLDLEKEYFTLIHQIYLRAIKQPDYEIILGDDFNKDDNINEDEIRKNTQFLSEEQAKQLMKDIDIELSFTEKMRRQILSQVQTMEIIRRVNYIRKKDKPSIIKQIALIAFTYPLIFERAYCLPDEKLPISEIASQNALYTELEVCHQEIIEQQWKENELQLDLLCLLNGYCKVYQKHNTTYPRIENILYKINVGFVLDWIKIDDFVKFIINNSKIYYLQQIGSVYGYDNSYIQQKSEQFQVQLYLYLFDNRDKIENYNTIELELDEQQQGSKQLCLMVNLLIYSQNLQQFLTVFEQSILETLKRAHKNFMAYQWWNKIKINQQLSGQDLGFLTQFCQQIQTKKLAKEIRFEQLDESYKQKIFQVERFKMIKQCYIVDNQKSIVIVNKTEDVLYLIDLQDNMIDNIRILYLMTDNPYYDQEKMIKPHYDECTQLIKRSIDEMI